MAKKVTKKPTSAAVLEGNLPKEVARVFHTYYLAFCMEGFNTEQAFKLTQQMADFYLNTYRP